MFNETTYQDTASQSDQRTYHPGYDGQNFKSFACEMLRLDKETYKKVPKSEKNSYKTHALSSISSYHHEDLVEEVKRIFTVAGRLESGRLQEERSRQPLSISIYNFCSATGTSYGRVASVLREFFASDFTKSYVCRLYKAGEICSKFPNLSFVTDMDKLHLISRVGEEVLAANLSGDGKDVAIGGKPINLSPREELKNFLKGEFPAVFSSRRRQQRPSLEDRSLQGLRATLAAHSTLLDKEVELKELILRCIELLNQRTSPS